MYCAFQSIQPWLVYFKILYPLIGGMIEVGGRYLNFKNYYSDRHSATNTP